MVWFCLKHKKSLNTLFKPGFLLACKIPKDPKIIEHLVQQTERFITSPTPPDPPPRPPSSVTKCTTSASTSTAADHTIEVPTTSKEVSSPTLHSKAHCRTLEFITEAAQELYTKGQLHIKPYAGYLKEKHKNIQSLESRL